MPKLEDLLEKCTADLEIVREKVAPKFLRADGRITIRSRPAS